MPVIYDKAPIFVRPKVKPRPWGTPQLVQRAVRDYYENDLGVPEPIVLAVPGSGWPIKNYGTLQTDVYTSGALIKADGIYVDGIDDRYYIPDNTIFTPSSALTVITAFTLHTQPPSGNEGLVAHSVGQNAAGEVVGQRSWALSVNTSNQVTAALSTNGAYAAGLVATNTSQTVPIGRVSTACLIWSSSSAFSVFMNYSKAVNATPPASLHNSTYPIMIGTQYYEYGNLQQAAGMICATFYSVKIFTEQLTDDQYYQEHATPYAAIQPRSFPSYFFVATGGAEGSTFEVVASDGITFTASASKLAAFLAQASDSFVANDSNAKTATFTVAATDGFAVNDSGAKTASLVSSLSDSIAVSDAITNIASLFAVSSDQAAFNDSAVTTQLIIALASDGLSLSDLPATTAVLGAVASDSANFSDSAIRTVLRLALTADGVTLADAPAVTAALQAVTQDGFAVTDEVIPLVFSALLGIVQDGIGISDATGATGALYATAAEAISLSDALSAVLSAIASAQDGLTLSDAALWQSAMDAIASDGIVLSDTASRLLHLLAQSADSIALSDTGAATAHFTVNCADSVSMAETLSVVMRFAATVSDGFTVTGSTREASNLPRGAVTITFNVKHASVSFTVKTPTVSFDL